MSGLSEVAVGLIHVIAAMVIALGLAQNLIYVYQLMLATRALADDPPERRESLIWRRNAAEFPAVSVLVPVHNEALTIVESVRSVLTLAYPRFEIIVINDGSDDDTLSILYNALDLQPTSYDSEAALQHAPVRGLYTSPLHSNLLVIDKCWSGKADALNAGVNHARNPIFCSMDGDSILEADALLRAMQAFLDDPERVIACGGTLRIANGCCISDGRVTKCDLPRNIWAFLQTVEYLRAFLMGRLAWSRVGAATIISGAFGLFKRSAVIEVGGYARGTVGEDMELVVRLHRFHQEQKRDYRIVFAPEPVCRTEVPETFVALARQRTRWQRGTLETLSTHRSMLFNPRYGRVGMLGFSAILLFDVVGPVAELLGYALIPLSWVLGILSVEYLLAFLAVTFAFGVALSVGSLALQELQLKRAESVRDLTTLAGAAVLENFGYRQLNTFWRACGLWQWIRGGHVWGEMTRKGFALSERHLKRS